MSAKQPEALRLAKGNENRARAWLESSDAHKFCMDTAAELRRLHAANLDCMEWYEAVKSERDELLEALEFVMCTSGLGCVTEAVVRAAIAKAIG